MTSDERSSGIYASLWDADDGNNDKLEMDLADMSAAAARFRVEMESKEFTSSTKATLVRDQDVLEGLISDMSTEDLQVSKLVGYDEKNKSKNNTFFENSYPQLDNSMSSMSSADQSSAMIGDFNRRDQVETSLLYPDIHRTTDAVQEIAEARWSYLDPQRNIQGPFRMSEMKNWSDAGYFKVDLLIRLEGWSNFYPLGIIYPEPGIAFLNGVPPEPSTIDMKQKICADSLNLSFTSASNEESVLSNSKLHIYPLENHLNLMTKSNRSELVTNIVDRGSAPGDHSCFEYVSTENFKRMANEKLWAKKSVIVFSILVNSFMLTVPAHILIHTFIYIYVLFGKFIIFSFCRICQLILE